MNAGSSKHEGDPLKFLKEILERYRPVAVEGLPRFYGGAVGFLGYDMVRFFERLPHAGEEGRTGNGHRCLF